MIDSAEQLRAVTALGVTRTDLIAVFGVLGERLRTLHGVVGCARSHGAIDSRAETVDVAPRALLVALAGVLFDGCVAGRHEVGDGACLTADGLARRAEVQQHRRTVTAHENIGRLDVAMNKALGMDHFEGVKQGMEDLQNLVLGQRAATLEQTVQAFALFVLHHHIGGVIGLKDVVHAHDGGMFEARQRARFEDEARETGLVFVDQLIGQRQHRAILLAMGELAR